MALVYLRLPHYISSYLRNIDADHPMTAGQPYVIERSDPLYHQVSFLAEPNVRNAVNIDCFSEKQWESMLKGKYLSLPSDGSFRMDLSRSYRTPLSVSEVFLLSCHEERLKLDPDTMEMAPDSEYMDSYLPVQLPSLVIREGREQKVYSDWIIPNISAIRNELIERYKMALSRFIALDRERANALHIKRSKMEAIDRFMLRYDIRPGDREREQIKKMMQRSAVSALMSFDTDADHGRWSSDLQPVSVRAVSAKRRILCVDTGKVYPSIAAFARDVGADSSAARKDLIRGHRCRGLRIESLDD